MKLYEVEHCTFNISTVLRINGGSILRMSMKGFFFQQNAISCHFATGNVTLVHLLKPEMESTKKINSLLHFLFSILKKQI